MFNTVNMLTLLYIVYLTTLVESSWCSYFCSTRESVLCLTVCGETTHSQQKLVEHQNTLLTIQIYELETKLQYIQNKYQQLIGYPTLKCNDPPLMTDCSNCSIMVDSDYLFIQDCRSQLAFQQVQLQHSQNEVVVYRSIQMTRNKQLIKSNQYLIYTQNCNQGLYIVNILLIIINLLNT